MSVSKEYLELLTTLNPRDYSLNETWNNVRADYTSGNTYLTQCSLWRLAEIALTDISKHSADNDTFKRSISWHFGVLIGEMQQLHRNKNAGYSGHNDDPWHNFRICNTFGVSTEHGIIARMCDKYARYTNIISDPSLEMVGEEWYDTLMDLAAYSLILSIILGEQS